MSWEVKNTLAACSHSNFYQPQALRKINMQRLATQLGIKKFELTKCKHRIIGLLTHICGNTKLFSVFCEVYIKYPT